MKDKLLNLQQENKLLKSQLETKFNDEKFSVEQQLADSQRAEKTLDAKNKALEKRITQLEQRLEKSHSGESSVFDMMTKQQEGEIAE